MRVSLQRELFRLAKRLHEPRQRVKQLLYPFQRRLAFSTEPIAERRAFMTFESSRKYGGWIDRAKGIISTYELARLTGRRFGFSTDDAFPLDDFLSPGEVDWHVADSDMMWNPLTTAFFVGRDRPSPRFAKLRESKRSQLYVDTNLDHLSVLHPEMSEAETNRLWGKRFRELFVVRPDFASEVERNVQSSALAVHARFTALLGDFKDVVDNSLPPRERDALLADSLRGLATLAREHSSQTVLVFSDSPTFLREAVKTAGNVTTIEGNPLHIDQANEARAALHKTFLDFFVLQRCERIVLLRVGPMYNSAFSRYASYVSGAPFSVLTG